MVRATRYKIASTIKITFYTILLSNRSFHLDIITKATREEIEAVLNKVCNGAPFKEFKLNERRSYQVGIPKAHYALVYNSGLTG